ncbi:MAG: hypothetical protein GW774_14305 [Flavobacteriales bacterium]|nr:hypothetical protein [Flavobacteriales bacterium]
MDLQTRKLEFIEEFIKIQSEEALSRFEKLLKKEKKSDLKPLTIEELNTRIDKSEADFINHRFKTNADLIAKYQ